MPFPLQSPPAVTRNLLVCVRRGKETQFRCSSCCLGAQFSLLMLVLRDARRDMVLLVELKLSNTKFIGVTLSSFKKILLTSKQRSV